MRKPTLNTLKIILWVAIVFQPSIYNIGDLSCKSQYFNWMRISVCYSDFQQSEMQFIPVLLKCTGILNSNTYVLQMDWYFEQKVRVFILLPKLEFNQIENIYFPILSMFNVIV